MNSSPGYARGTIKRAQSKIENCCEGRDDKMRATNL